MRMFDDSEDDEDKAVAQQGQQTVSSNAEVINMRGMATSNSRAEESSSEELDFLSNTALKQRNTTVNGWVSVPQ